MKYLFLIFVALQLVSCDPPRVKPRFFATLKANIVNEKQVFRLGDTIKLRVSVGDSLEYDEIVSDTILRKGKIYTNSLEEAFYGFSCDRFDTLNGGVYSYSASPIFVNVISKTGKLRAGVGGVPAGDGYLSNQQKPYTSELYFIPKEKGIYFIELRYQPVSIKINNNFEAQLSVIFDETVNRNAEIYCKYSISNTYNNDIQLCLGDVNNRKRFYTFRVE
jgi:hypothetical protein